jgi:ATP-binding cassette subfamily G (WHITE) protein 2 (SNQ2)
MDTVPEDHGESAVEMTAEVVGAKTSPSINPKQQRRQRSAPHVDPDFFDPQGFRDLHRTLSRLSSTSPDRWSESEVSGDTLFSDGQFDFERIVRTLIKK